VLTPNSIFEEIKIDKDSMLEMCYWCFLKYQIDPSSRQGLGGREDKIGSFIDRFSNNIINWLIFKNIFKAKSYTVESDFFFYSQKSAKKGADVLGIKKNNGELIPFFQFNNTAWEKVISEAPFIEVKGLRKNQNLAHLGLPQFARDHFYCYVETDFDEHYLLNLFDKEIYNYSKSMEMNPIYIKDNTKGIILSPSSLSPPSKIGSLRLLGIYKGTEIEEHFTKCEGGVKPYYLSSIEELSEKDKRKHKNFVSIKLTNGKYNHNPCKSDGFIPFYLSNKKLLISDKNSYKSYMVLKINEETEINKYLLKPGIYKLIFKKFERSSKETEYINYKSILNHNNQLENYLTDCTKELINLIDQIALSTD